MKLFGYWRSSSSWRVRVGLALKGVDYEYVAVHLVEDGGQQHQEEFREKNPLRQIPVLLWDEEGEPRSLSQSMAILEFLEERYPTPSILPGSAAVRGKIRQLAEVVNSGIQPLQNLAVMQRLKGESEIDVRAWSAYWIRRGLEAYEKMLIEDEGVFSVGDEPTLADICLIPQLYNARRFEVELSDLPGLLRVEEACEGREAFQVSHPDQQPDAAQ